MRLPYIPFSAERLREIVKILLAGNEVFENLFQRARRKNNAPKNKTDFRKLVFDAIDDGTRLVCDIRMLVREANSIQQVRRIQDEVVHGHAALAHQKVKRWMRRAVSSYPTWDDYANEATVAMINAVYGYRKRPGKRLKKLATYMGQSVYKALFKAYNASNPLSPMTKRDRKLRARFDELQSQQSDYCNLDRMIEIMEDTDGPLTADQRKALVATMPTVIPASELRQSNETRCRDYSSYGRIIVSSPPKTKGSRPQEGQPVLEIVASANPQLSMLKELNLSQFEQDVLLAAANNEGRGWQSRICEQYNYSRRAAGAALLRIRQKLQHLKKTA